MRKELACLTLSSILDATSEIKLKIFGEKKRGRRQNVCVQVLGMIKKLKVFRRVHMRGCTNKVLRMGAVPGKVWSAAAFGKGPRERLLRRQLAGATGEKSSVSHSLFLEGNILENVQGGACAVFCEMIDLELSPSWHVFFRLEDGTMVDLHNSCSKHVRENAAQACKNE